MRRTYHVLSLAILCFVGLAAPQAYAVPATFNVTPTAVSTSAGGSVTGHNIYRDCVLATQAKGARVAQIGTAAPFAAFQIVGDTASPPTICSTPTGPGGEGTFANVVTLNGAAPPGADTITATCTLSLTAGGTGTCTTVSAP